MASRQDRAYAFIRLQGGANTENRKRLMFLRGLGNNKSAPQKIEMNSLMNKLTGSR